MPLLAESTVETDADPAAVWAVWSDLALRPRWHPGLAWARLDGPLAPGTIGAWKPERARPVAVRVAEVVPGRRLVLVGTHGPPVARGHYEHEVVPRPGSGSVVTHRMRVTGPLARPIARLFGGALGVFAGEESTRAVVRLAAEP
ncbi:MAG: SRPBCC family protein [Actinomycetota bacterium]|nr:SRPBCC family protein [Actinomycetota bacterium]